MELLEDRRLLDAAAGSEALQLFSTSTALFVENQGQWQDEAVRYGFDGPGVNIAFTDDGLTFLLTQRDAPQEPALAADPHEFDALAAPGDDGVRATQFSVSFANAVTPVGLDAGETKFNYFVGDEANWRTAVSGFQTVAYENLYDGIDLHTFGRRDSLKYEFYVAPGSDYRQIEVDYDGIEGLSINDAGALHVETALGTLVDDAPYIYQVIDGVEVAVAGQFALVDADTYAFEITGAYDPAVELVIDPDLAWSTYLGGSDSDLGADIAIDAAGAAYITGTTHSTDFPTTAGAFDTSHNDSADAFVAKFTSGGAPILFGARVASGRSDDKVGDDCFVVGAEGGGRVPLRSDSRSVMRPGAVGLQRGYCAMGLSFCRCASTSSSSAQPCR